MTKIVATTAIPLSYRLPEGKTVRLGVGATTKRDMFGTVFEIGADGCVEPLERPGIGLDVDEAIFDRFPAIDGPGYVVTF